jgi:hypothetical protein
MDTNQKMEIKISPFDRFKELATNLVSVPKSKVVEEDKKERKRKKNRIKKQKDNGHS